MSALKFTLDLLYGVFPDWLYSKQKEISFVASILTTLCSDLSIFSLMRSCLVYGNSSTSTPPFLKQVVQFGLSARYIWYCWKNIVASGTSSIGQICVRQICVGQVCVRQCQRDDIVICNRERKFCASFDWVFLFLHWTEGCSDCYTW